MKFKFTVHISFKNLSLQVVNICMRQVYQKKACYYIVRRLSHPSDDIFKTKDDNIFVTYLPPNVTSLIQPMNQGVLESFKRNYT